MSKIIKFQPSFRIVDSCKYCMYSHWKFKNKFLSTKEEYFCLHMIYKAKLEELKQAKIPTYQGDKDSKYVDWQESSSYVYIENPDAILDGCPLEEYVEEKVTP